MISLFGICGAFLQKNCASNENPAKNKNEVKNEFTIK